MPNRIIREGILTSEAINSLSFAAEVFYRRLMSRVDDFGRYDARPAILLAELYALKIGSVSVDDIAGWMQECVNAGLVLAYEVEGKPYLQIEKFNQRTRSRESKWPAPPDDGHVTVTCAQMRADDGHMTVTCPSHDGHMRANDGLDGDGDGDGDGDEYEVKVSTSDSFSADTSPDADAKRPVVDRRRGKSREPPIRWDTSEGWQNITDQHRARWSEAYPACDITRQLAAMDAWLRANPKKSRKRNYERFITNWLAREQERGGDLRGSTDRRSKQAAREGAESIEPRFLG